MAIEQRDIASTLRFMDDRALQQYAAMHKNDPYIFPLAFQESQNRQRLRMSQQAQMAQQPQPKVADQALAAMLPEEQGIGALPAGNMQEMADGGIVGYEGYDESGVANTFGQGPVMMMAEGGVARYSGEFGSLVESFPIDPLTGTFYMPGHFDSPADPASMRRVRTSPYVAPQLSAEETALLQRFPKPTGAPKPDAKSKDTAPKVGPERKTPAATTEPTAKTDTGGLDSLIKNFTRQTDLAQGALQNRRVGLANQLETEAAGEAEAVKKRIREEGDVFAGREARLAAREKGLEGMGDKYMGLALLQAGAAMMSTPGNLGTVLGKGIAVGSERYIAGIDKINAAKDKFAEARDRLEDLRLNRDDMNKKEVRDAERAVRTARLQGQQLLVDGATNDLKISNDNQKAIFGVAAESILTDKKITSAEKIARLQAASGNRNNQLELLQAVNADPKLMAAYRAMQGRQEDIMGQYNDFLKANPALAMDPKAAFTQFLMTKSAFQQLGTPTVTDKPTGPVRN